MVEASCVMFWEEGIWDMPLLWVVSSSTQVLVTSFPALDFLVHIPVNAVSAVSVWDRRIMFIHY